MMRSLFSGVSGLRNHQIRMDVIGNNIANVNTVGFKRSRVNFQDMMVQTLRGASAPQAGRGGTNPAQVGLGANIGSIDSIFTQGSLQATGKVTDMAVQGEGFFLLSDGVDYQYTRAGNFDLDRDGILIDKGTGMKVMGWMADATGNINSNSAISSLMIPIGRSYSPTPTSSVTYGGNLNSGAAVGTIHESTIDIYDSQGNTHRAIATFTKAADNEWSYAVGLDSGDALIQGYLNTWYPGFTSLAQATQQQVLNQANGVYLGGNASATGIGRTTGLGVHLTADAKGAAGNDIRVRLTLGAGWDINVSGNDIDVTYPAGATLDDLVTQLNAWPGAAALVNASLDVTANGANVIQDEAWTNLANGSNSYRTGTIKFTTTGAVDEAATRSANGATSPNLMNAFMFTPTSADTVSVLPDVKELTQYMSAFTALAKKQNGNPSGTLETMSVSKSGTVTGIFSNGFSLDLGMIGLAVFNNPAGLLRMGDNLFKESNNSGTAQRGTAESGGRGNIIPGTLEMSNVDLAQEFTDMIVTQRGFQANTRIITTTDDMLQELANLKR